MAKYVTEVLAALNKDPALFKTEYLCRGDGGPLRTIFYHAFIPSWRFILPEGVPPHKPSAEPLGMTPAQFITEVKRFQLFCRKDLPSIKREQLFIQMMESIHPDEVKILVAIKDQCLDELYPNITLDQVIEAGYIPPPPPGMEIPKRNPKVEDPVAEPVKTTGRSRGRPSRKTAAPQI